jgi:hypothetical protein
VPMLIDKGRNLRSYLETGAQRDRLKVLLEVPRVRLFRCGGTNGSGREDIGCRSAVG